MKANIFVLMAIFFTVNTALADLADINELKQDYIRPDFIPFPENNPYSDAKSSLGKSLYFDPRLSKSGTQSCATCHNPSFSWGDGMPVGVGHGHKKLGRKSPTILNLAWDELYMWDGRKDNLEEQALGPVESEDEMNMDIAKIPIILGGIRGYESLFKDAFPDDDNPITNDNVRKAIATYERTVISPKNRFDLWIDGDETALNDEEKKGFVLFNTKANCSNCHSEWMFSDGSFHDIGLPSKDIGRGKILPNVEKMQHAFKTVGLRDIALRAPYMHDGSLATLEEVVDHYNSGSIKRPSLSVEIVDLGLSEQEKKQLVAFLNALTGPEQSITMPRLPR